MYTNADNLMNKRSEFEVKIALHSPDIVFISEYAPKNTSVPVQVSELQISGYDLCSNSENCKRGVVIYTKCSLKASPAKDIAPTET